MTASTRRAALGAILAAPLASVPAVAALPPIPAEEAAFLAIGPKLVRLLDEHDLEWAKVHLPYEAWRAACDRQPGADLHEQIRLPEYQVYLEARAAADDLMEEADALYRPFMDLPLQTLPAIMLRHRVGMSMEALEDDAKADLNRLWREGKLCA